MAEKTLKPRSTKKKTVSEVLREAKIQILKENVAFAKTNLLKLEEQKQSILSFNLSGVKVCHKVFGDGEILSRDNTSISALFKAGQKRFVVPNAFTDGFLTTTDKKLSDLLSQYTDLCAQIDKLNQEISSHLVTISLLEKM